MSTAGLELHGKLAEDLGVNLGVDFAGAKLLFWDDHRIFPFASAHCKARVMQQGVPEPFLAWLQVPALSARCGLSLCTTARTWDTQKL